MYLVYLRCLEYFGYSGFFCFFWVGWGGGGILCSGYLKIRVVRVGEVEGRFLSGI